MFGRLHTVGRILGLADVLPEGRFGAWLDPNGNLFVDQGHVQELVAALADRLSPEVAEASAHGLRDACHALLACTDRAASSAPALDGQEARELLVELGERVAALLPYPLMTKFVPGVLQRSLDARANPSPVVLAGRSPGARLTDALLALRSSCLAAGYTADRVAASWPSVPGDVAEAVSAFCDAHTGFGPVPWEGPGFETPEYALAVMRGTFAGLDEAAVEVIRARCSGNDDGPPTTSLASPVGRALETWLEFMDLQIWYIRGSFYKGMVPLLRTIAGSSRGLRHPEHLLFVRVEEFAQGEPDPDTIEDRVRTYLSDVDYLERIGGGWGRLGAIMAAS